MSVNGLGLVITERGPFLFLERVWTRDESCSVRVQENKMFPPLLVLHSDLMSNLSQAALLFT